MAVDMTKFMARFIAEAREHIEKLNQGLLTLEKHPNDPETLNAVFRSAHTVKGSSRMMRLTPISEVAHKVEEVLDALRGERLQLSSELSDVLFSAIDTMADMVEKTASGAEISTDTQDLCRALETAAGGEKNGKADHELELPESVPSNPNPRALDNTIRVNTERLDGLIKLVGEMVTSQSLMKQRIMEVKHMEKLARRCTEAAQGLDGTHPSTLQSEAAQSMRALHLGLRRLITSMTEDANTHELLTHGLQEDALGMRMLPLSTLFESFHRTVRDLSKALGKKVRFVAEGGETELDKKMVEKIGDPIVHMIRNAIDHGIERPEERLRRGKPEEGFLRLSASYEGENVLIELRDDGGGIPWGKVREKCLQKKLFTEELLDSMPDGELTHLIFHPGFSTSEIITDISGRGVGMDVVRRNIVEHLKGSIQVDTREGKGTAFHIRLLLTLAIMHVLLISVSDVTFALPANTVSEIVRVPESGLIDVVERKAVRLREQIIPVVGLDRVLGLPASEHHHGRGLLILVVSMGTDRLGLIVDALLSEENAVMKPLPPHMQNIRLVSGVTTSGRNEIINVLNVSEIVEAAREMRYERRMERKEKSRSRTIHILVVDDSVSTREIEKNILEAYGYAVTLAGDGVEALEKASSFQYDVIVTDVEMPRLDGFSLTERLRRDDTHKETPIILVTSRDRDSDKRRGIQVGANAYIVKGSFDQANLVDTIRNFVG